MKPLMLCLIMLHAASAAEVTDATGRHVTVPDHIDHVLPAGPPAAILLAAIAPGQTMGFTSALSDAARSALPPQVAALPPVPRLTAGQDIDMLRPDLIVDYGTVSPRYTQLAEDTQQKTGIPSLLFDGALDQVPVVARSLGQILHQPERAETVARLAEAILALPPSSGAHPRVFYARGTDGMLAAAPGTDITAVFTRLGWQVVVPDGSGTFRSASVKEINSLDPDMIILANPAAKDVLASPAWSSLRAVRDGHAYIAPSVPFGWIEEPPSINRLLGLAWLRGGDPLSLAAMFNAAVYGRALTTEQLHAIAGTTASIKP